MYMHTARIEASIGPISDVKLTDAGFLESIEVF